MEDSPALYGRNTAKTSHLSTNSIKGHENIQSAMPAAVTQTRDIEPSAPAWTAEEVFELHGLGRTRVVRETRPLSGVSEANNDVLHAWTSARIIVDLRSGV